MLWLCSTMEQFFIKQHTHSTCVFLPTQNKRIKTLYVRQAIDFELFLLDHQTPSTSQIPYQHPFRTIQTQTLSSLCMRERTDCGHIWANSTSVEQKQKIPGHTHTSRSLNMISGYRVCKSSHSENTCSMISPKVKSTHQSQIRESHKTEHPWKGAGNNQLRLLQKEKLRNPASMICWHRVVPPVIFACDQLCPGHVMSESKNSDFQRQGMWSHGPTRNKKTRNTNVKNTKWTFSFGLERLESSCSNAKVSDCLTRCPKLCWPWPESHIAKRSRQRTTK